ncbi:MAG: CDP-glycerol glycerophosphotransferase family protein [Desulfovibrio sp.]|nr:CDP-glycerol glycerophosphotransferase family protein [Desulfovibrio sp.]
MTAVSVVIAVHNVQAYLPRFAHALRNQTFQDFEALFIDDASTDDSAALIEGFASAEPRFRLLRHEKNLGCGAACNTGIRAAQGETLCFADPDDLLPENSLEVRYAAHKKHNAVVRACHDEITADGRILNHETRPAGLPEICSPADAAPRVGVNPFLCAHWTWLMPTPLLQRRDIFHGEGMRTGDDIFMLARLFFNISRLVWLPDTVYHWIKRDGSLSATTYTPEHYANYFQCCDIFYEEAAKRRQVRLADTFCDTYLTCYLTHLLQQAIAGKSREGDVREVIAEMTGVCERHGVFSRCLPELRKNPLRQAGLYRLRHILRDKSPSATRRLVTAHNNAARLVQEAEYDLIRKNGWKHEITFDKFDAERGLLRARYLFRDRPPEEEFLCGGVSLAPAFAKNRSVFDGKGYAIFERILWLPVPKDARGDLNLRIGGKDAGPGRNPADIRASFTPPPLNDKNFPPEARALRRLVRSEAVREKFRNAWMFIDKDTEADDNAEHLYRWVMREHPEINAWFALNASSHDWPRLEQEGFKLVAHGSDAHKLCYLLSARLISSQMDHYIFNVVEEKFFPDFSKPKFVCLPHGVTKDDVSDWFNSIPFDLFITATHQETESIIGDGSPYLLTAKETRLCGFPRYDKWLEPGVTENLVFVMPTWRADLVGTWDGKGQRREINPDFYASRYVKMWREFFEDPRLEATLNNHHYGIVFFAHPGFEDYIEDMPFPDFVEKRSKKHGSIVDAMKKSRVMITDFSSVAYDMAYMRKPVIYYQYENKDAFIRSQSWKNGYVDYASMGFGPVCRNRDALCAALEEALRTGCVMGDIYAGRAAASFAFHDAHCRERAFDAIFEDSRPWGGKIFRQS